MTIREAGGQRVVSRSRMEGSIFIFVADNPESSAKDVPHNAGVIQQNV